MAADVSTSRDEKLMRNNVFADVSDTLSITSEQDIESKNVEEYSDNDSNQNKYYSDEQRSCEDAGDQNKESIGE